MQIMHKISEIMQNQQKKYKNYANIKNYNVLIKSV